LVALPPAAAPSRAARRLWRRIAGAVTGVLSLAALALLLSSPLPLPLWARARHR
jgi:hypothetical protein